MKIHWYQGVLIFIVLIMGLKVPEAKANTEFQSYRIIYDENETTIDCFKNESGILLIPLHQMLDFLGCEYTECGRCGKDEVWNEKYKDPKGWVYVNWDKNLLSYSADPMVVLLDTDNIKLDGTTYTSQMVYSYLGYEIILDQDNKSMEVRDIPWGAAVDESDKVTEETNNIDRNSSITAINSDMNSSMNSRDTSQELVTTISASTLIVYVYDPYCSSCKEITSLIDEIEQTYDNGMLRLDASTKLNMNEIKEYEEKSQVPDALRDLYPALYIGNQYLINQEITMENVQKIMNGEAISHNIVEAVNQDEEQILNAKVNYIKNLIYFKTSTCGACREVSNYLDHIKLNYPGVIVTEYNLNDEAKNIKLLKAYGKQYGIEKEQIGEIPAIFISDQYLIGRDEIINHLMEAIAQYDQTKQTVDLAAGGTKIESDILYGVAAFGAGLLNGINPCSLSMFLFLASLMMLERKKILKIGISFCIGKFAMFFLLGTIFYQLISYMNIQLIHLVTKCILFIFILALVVLNINDFIMARAEKYNKMLLQLPSWMKGFNHRVMKKASKYIESKYLIFIMLLLGMLLAFGEFMCTGQIYLTSIVLFIQESQMEWLSILYLLVYCVGFILPLLILTLLVYFGRKVFHLSEVVLKRLPMIKLISSILFILFGIYLLLQ